MATTGTKLPGLKPIPAKVDKELAGSLKAMQEALAVRLGQLGDPLDRAITLRELIDSGLAKKLADNPFDPNAGLGPIDFGPPDDGPGDLSIPPAPVSLTATGVFTQVILDWNGTSASAPYGNHAYTEIWRSRDNNLAGATLRATTTAFIYTDEVGYNETYYYWVRYVSTSDVQGPFNNTNGAEATTLQDIAAVMTELSETLADLPGYNLLATSTTAATIIKSSSEPSTRTNGDALQPNDIWFDTDDGQIYTRNTSNNAWVAGRDSTLVNLFGATSFTGSTLTAAMATAQSDIVTVTNAQSSTASSLSSLSSTVTSNNNTLTASVNTLNTTTASHTGDLNAMFVLQVATESNGSKSAAGMVIGSSASNGSGAQSYVQFQADKFAIWSGSSNVAPFIVSSGTVFIDSARIQDGAITNARIANLAVEEGKISNLAVTNGKIGNLAVTEGKIQNLAVTNAKIADATIQDAKIANLNANKITAGFISADRINSNTITADKINVTDLTLEFTAATVSGATLGGFASNTPRLKQVADIGTEPGVYHIMCRVFGSTGQVKTLSIVAGDGTFGAGSSFELRNDFSYSDGTNPTIPTADQGYAQYHSGQSQYWSAINRFDGTNEMAQKDFLVRKVSSTSRTLRLYILAQGDGGTRYLSSVQYGVYRFSEI